MDFKSHQEVILPASEEKKKRAQEDAPKRASTPQVREVHLPGGKKRVTITHSSIEDVVVPQLPVREVQISAEKSRVEGAAASLTPGEPVEKAEVELKVLNAGIKLLNEASRHGSPGGRLLRASQGPNEEDAVENARPQPPPPEPAAPPRQVSTSEVREVHIPPKKNVVVEDTRSRPSPPEPAPRPTAPPREPARRPTYKRRRGEDLTEPRPVVPRPVAMQESGDADLVWKPPAQADEEESSAKEEKYSAKEEKRSTRGTPKRSSVHQKPYRDFIIAYDGVFIGHFRSRKRITNRTAFQQVARQLHATVSSFDMRKLQLYRPVPLDVTVPDSLPEISDGAFMWFADRQPPSETT